MVENIPQQSDLTEKELYHGYEPHSILIEHFLGFKKVDLNILVKENPEALAQDSNAPTVIVMGGGSSNAERNTGFADDLMAAYTKAEATGGPKIGRVIILPNVSGIPREVAKPEYGNQLESENLHYSANLLLEGLKRSEITLSKKVILTGFSAGGGLAIHLGSLLEQEQAAGADSAVNAVWEKGTGAKLRDFSGREKTPAELRTALPIDDVQLLLLDPVALFEDDTLRMMMHFSTDSVVDGWKKHHDLPLRQRWGKTWEDARKIWMTENGPATFKDMIRETFAPRYKEFREAAERRGMKTTDKPGPNADIMTQDSSRKAREQFTGKVTLAVPLSAKVLPALFALSMDELNQEFAETGIKFEGIKDIGKLRELYTGPDQDLVQPIVQRIYLEQVQKLFPKVPKDQVNVAIYVNEPAGVEIHGDFITEPEALQDAVDGQVKLLKV